MKIGNRYEKGFTLIEVIVTLVLVGISAALAGMWIISVVNGYIFAKTNAETVQKAQLAMTRLAKEFANIDAITAASATAITYTRKDSALNTTGPYVISQSGDALQITTGGTGNTLTDSVSNGGFSLMYCDDIPPSGPQVCSTNWPSTGTRRIIEITLTLKGADNTTSTFTKRVVPRNL